MCGIVCYVGKSVPLGRVLENLLNLEYRGYDSSGIAYKIKGKIETKKAIGRISNLQSIISGQSNVIISHTRWATHGGVTKSNAHPHCSPDGRFAIVHNGIIENYAKLKSQFNSQDFSSSTDTEVIAHLLQQQHGDTLQRLSKTTQMLDGSWALAVIDQNSEDLFIAKNKSPLYVCINGNYAWVASDICCFDGNSYYALPDGCIGQVGANQVKFFVDGKQVQLPLQTCSAQSVNSSLEGYKHYMQKEMAEIPSVLGNICEYYKKHIGDLSDIFKGAEDVVFVGCGTAYHACMLAANWAKKFLGISANAVIASEYRYSLPVINKKSVVVLVSQSGETADTLAVGQLAKDNGAKVVAVTNVEHSLMANLADITLPLRAGREVAVASTKAYCAMQCVLYLLTCGTSVQEAISCIKNLPLYYVMSNPISQDVIDSIKASHRVFFIGRLDDGVTAQEGALKLKEIAYLDASGYFAGELKHGTIALIEPGTWVIAIITDDAIASKTLSAVEEVRSRGANVLVITNRPLQGDYYTLLIPDADCAQLNSLLAIMPLQQLSYSVAVGLGWDPDHPRNLAKSVTVE